MGDDSFSAFKLHSNYSPNPYCICAHCNLRPLGEEEGGITITSSSRWSPTPAQLLYLEQLYTQGTKTPTAQQIQLIASQLHRFGNIQAKNVFYWFQNHKARDRYKRRRSHTQISPPPPPAAAAAALQHAPRQGYEVKETKKWASSSNCSALAEVSDSLHRAERGAYRRTQREEERETQIFRIKREKSQEAKCQIRDHMSSFFLSNSKHRFIKSITTHTQTSNPTNCYRHDDEEEEVADDRTLKLFPLKRSDGDDESSKDKDKFCSFNASMDSDEITSNQFFEFLPLRSDII